MACIECRGKAQRLPSGGADGEGLPRGHLETAPANERGCGRVC